MGIAGPQSQLNLRSALLGQRPPEILVHGIVTPQDVDHLFKMCVSCPISLDHFLTWYSSDSTKRST